MHFTVKKFTLISQISYQEISSPGPLAKPCSRSNSHLSSWGMEGTIDFHHPNQVRFWSQYYWIVQLCPETKSLLIFLCAKMWLIHYQTIQKWLVNYMANYIANYKLNELRKSKLEPTGILPYQLHLKSLFHVPSEPFLGPMFPHPIIIPFRPGFSIFSQPCVPSTLRRALQLWWGNIVMRDHGGDP